MSESLGDLIRKIPKKETVDFAKNFTFAVGLQAVALSLVAPHSDRALELDGVIYAGLISVCTAIVAMFSAGLYLEAFQGVSPRRHWLFTILCMAAMFGAGQAAKAKLLELF